MRKLYLALFGIFCIGVHSTVAQTFRLIKPITSSSSPSGQTTSNGKVFFSASDNQPNFELWVTDGTPGGTVMLKDFHAPAGSRPQNFTDVNGTMFFTAEDASNGRELWKSDGTPGGTVLVKNI